MAKETRPTPQPQVAKVEPKTRFIMNKSQRAFHAKPDVIIGGEVCANGTYKSINPGETVEVIDSYGLMMVKNYPDQIVDVSKGR